STSNINRIEMLDMSCRLSAQSNFIAVRNSICIICYMFFHCNLFSMLLVLEHA
uniref:Uncharacterized protein n=1 Tax=Aegilops tauschii subsp. strangulata TaxID=200361 RepID=A0A453C5Q5_AEGTS